MRQLHPNQYRTLCALFIAALVALVVPAFAQEPAATHRLYLPILQTARSDSVFGLEMFHISPARGLGLVVATDTRWVRRNGLFWKDVEPVPGKGYRWDAPSVKLLEQELITASKNNLNLILIVRASPRWATEPYQADCAPVNPAHYDDFARFMAAAVERYSKPPYNVKYWEVGNEPDAYIFPSDAPYGCWGVKGDPYYGGEAYGRALRVVSAAMKQANPTIKVLNGGLLLDRPYNPDDPTSTPGRFFEGMLRAGAGDAFDIVSFHGYDYYYGPNNPQPLGPREDWRVAYLRGLMEQYNIAPKPLMRTESALLCPKVTAECRWAQADYMARLYARAMRDNLLGNLWYIYDHDGFHSGALVEPGDVFNPRPAYFAYRQAAIMLGGKRYSGPVTGLPEGVESYYFSGQESDVVILWSDKAQQVSLWIGPSRQVSCVDRDGGQLSCPLVNGRISVFAHSSPVYVILR